MSTSAFRYQSFEPTSLVRMSAEMALTQIENCAPRDAAVVAQLEFDGQEYACSIDVFLKYRSVYTFVAGADAISALDQAVGAICEKLQVQTDVDFLSRFQKKKSHSSSFSSGPSYR